MIIPQESLSFLLNKKGFYTGLLTTKRWGYQIFREQITPYGSIALFESPVQIGIMTLKKALVIAIELPECNAFGSACFTRLYCAQLGSLLSELTKKDCFVDGNSLIVEDKQISLSFSNNIANTALVNIVICTETQKKQNILTPLPLNEEFKTNAIEAFHHLTKNIFIETQRDNF